ncbi:hypothetical protein HNR12_003116 [Streptomonospora nanhaiensis]|nr:hypothetical protein [Streptomonospora nanhaiensis]
MHILAMLIAPLALIARLIRPARGLHAAPPHWARFEPDEDDRLFLARRHTRPVLLAPGVAV